VTSTGFEPGTPPADADDHVLATWLAEVAGRRLLEVRGEGLEGKGLKDAGDAAAHELLMRLVAEHRPHDAVLSEEGKDDKARLSAERVWIIDPLDGTREFSEPPRDDWAVQHWNQDTYRHRLQFDPHNPDGVRDRNSIWIQRLFRWRAGLRYEGAHNALFLDGRLVAHPAKLGDDPAARFPGFRLRHVQDERPYERIFRKDRYYQKLDKTEEATRKRYCF